MSSPMEVCKSDMTRCAIEWQPSEAAFSVWPPKTERASQGKRPYSVSAVPDRMMLSESYTLMGLGARSTTTRSCLLGSVSMGTLAHTGWSFVAICAICLQVAPINASGLLGRQPAKSGSTTQLEPTPPRRFELPESIIPSLLLVEGAIDSQIGKVGVSGQS
jgi:hypothetical protein